MRKVLFITTLLAFILTSLACAGDISGTWTVSMKSPHNEDEAFDLVIKAEGENLTITCSNHPKFTNLEGTGTLKGDAITMELTAPGLPNEFVFTGKVAGKNMSGTREIDIPESAEGQGPAPEGGLAPPGATPPEGEQGGQAAPAEGAPPGDAPEGGQEGGQAAQGEDEEEVSDAWTAVKK